MPTATIGTDSAQIVAYNLTRDAILIKNTHATSNLHISFGETATTGHWYLGPGETFVESPERVYRGAINGISSSGDITVNYTEREK